MTKQEEIRMGLATNFFWTAHPGGDWSVLADIAKEFYLERADIALRYLHSHGGVLKVESDLPNNKNLYGVAKDNMAAGCYYHGQMDMKEAGFVATEPLIEDK